MNQALLDKIESEQFRKDGAKFAVGDTVRVHTKVVEGDKERIQIFSGVVKFSVNNSTEFCYVNDVKLLISQRQFDRQALH